MRSHGHPQVSVVIPTFRRPDLLPRAVGSVLNQSFTDWELIITDDEREPNRSRDFGLDLAARDPRIRVLCNSGERGQAGNFNCGFAAARAAWIKPLCDDDSLLSGCLEHMLAAARLQPRASLVRSLTQFHRADGVIARPRVGIRPTVEALGGPSALLAMFLQDVEIGSPTQVLVRRDAVLAGAAFPVHPTITGGADELWYTRLLERGDLLLVNRVLTSHFQSGHATITSGLSARAFEAEMLQLKSIEHSLVSELKGCPSLRAGQQAALLERALWRLLHADPLAAASIMARSTHPRAWIIAARWLLRRAFPGRFEIVPRTTIDSPAPRPHISASRRAAPHLLRGSLARRLGAERIQSPLR